MIRETNAKFGDVTEHNALSDYTQAMWDVIEKEHWDDDAELYVNEEVDAMNFVGSYPTSMDWRTHSGKLSSMKDQGSCGSCWAFAATGAIESAWAIKHSTNATKLAPQLFVNCIPSGCDGGHTTKVYDWTTSHYAYAESTLPYTGKDGTCHYDKSKATNIKSGGTGSGVSSKNVDSMKNRIAQ